MATESGGARGPENDQTPLRAGAGVLAHPCPVVGIGASAGGLDAFRQLFAAMPADSGMAFVVVQHLAPDHETLIPELLARHTCMPVHLAVDGVQVEPNHVYVIPQDATLTIDGCQLRLARPAEPRGRRMPVDAFFRSLAEDQGHNAVGIVLSGLGTDGTLGLTAIKENGGLALVQSPETAAAAAMPRSAALTGVPDAVLPIEQMPARLLAHAGQLTRRGPQGPEELRREVTEQLAKVCALLRTRTGHDFSRYKQSTLMRRVERRIHLLQQPSAAHYVELLRRDRLEADQLFKDLLIGVTHFFRDPEAFEALARLVMPRLFAQRAGEEQMRVWVPGCATGEEAYSIAMLLREAQEGLDDPPRVQIFATDLDLQALEMARQGTYPERIAEQVSPERLARFFVKQGNLYQVSQEIRGMCLFSQHNLIADPPFSRLDLISCRNLLIYLESELQQRLLPLYHYALKPGGFLFLGPSESVEAHPDLFRALDKKHRIYQARQTVVRPVVYFPLTELGRPPRPSPEGLARRARGHDLGLVHALEQVLLDEFAPACVVVNERGDIVYFSPRTGGYLEPPGGAPTLNVVQMARKGLRLDLRTALHQAAARRATVVREGVEVEIPGRPLQRINLVVRPLCELGEDSGLLLVAFQEVAVAAPGRPAGPAPELPHEPRVEDLEDELRRTRSHLHATVEQLESSNEELVSSNEELLSMNEELQSANEELQTSKEELQSVNEEVETVNAELKKKLEELARAHDDLKNLFESTRIATLFLDTELRLKRFTPAAAELLHLVDADADRPFSDFARAFGIDLAGDAREVLRTLGPREREVLLFGDGTYMSRMLPYRTVDNVIAGVVITMIDVTEARRAEEQRARLAAIVESSQDAILSKTLDGVITSWNQGAERMYGYTEEEVIGQRVDLLFPPGRGEEVQGIFERLRRGERIAPYETVRLRKDGTPIDVRVTVSPVRGPGGELIGGSAIARDVTERKQAEQALRESEERFHVMADTVPSILYTATPDGACDYANRRFYEHTGLPDGAAAGIGWVSSLHPDDAEVVGGGWMEAVREGRPYEADCRLRGADGTFRWFVVRSRPVRDEAGRIVRWFGAIADVEDLKRIQEALAETARRKDEFLAMLGHELRNPLAPIRNSLHLLAEPRASEEQRERARAVLDRQAAHMARLVDDLLDMSRVSRGKILLRRRRVDLAELVRVELEDHRPGLEAAGLTVAARLDGPLRVDGDPTRLSQIVGNLLRNAGKFTDPGGRVEVDLTRGEDGGAVLAVRDTGIGIAAELLPRLFEPFSQADHSLDRSRGGLGLGLALVKSLVELHGGSVEAASEGPGWGAVFTLRLPAAGVRAGAGGAGAGLPEADATGEAATGTDD